jgi:iron complex transport system substrate-binding protein
MSQKGKTEKLFWTVLTAAVAALVAFTGGYYLGVITTQSEGIMFVDDYGRQIKLSEIPQRIVSVAPTATEILFAVGAGSQVVGVDEMSDYPAEAANLPKVGNYVLSAEAIVALKPDLIICADLVPEALDNLQDQGYPYIVLAARTVTDAIKDIRLVGVVTGHVEGANEVASALEVRLDAVKAKILAANVSRPDVYLEYYGPDELWTFGPGSFGDDLIRLAGGVNIAANTSSEYPLISSEFVVGADPDIIVYTVGVMTTTNATSIAERPSWNKISAVMSGAIFPIDENLVVRYGPRILDGLEQMAEILHPELFP